MAMANMNLIGVFVTKLWPVQALACGGGDSGGAATKNIISPKLSNFGDIITGSLPMAHTIRPEHTLAAPIITASSLSDVVADEVVKEQKGGFSQASLSCQNPLAWEVLEANIHFSVLDLGMTQVSRDANLIGGRLQWFIGNWTRLTQDPKVLQMVRGCQVEFVKTHDVTITRSRMAPVLPGRDCRVGRRDLQVAGKKGSNGVCHGGRGPVPQPYVHSPQEGLAFKTDFQSETVECVGAICSFQNGGHGGTDQSGATQRLVLKNRDLKDAYLCMAMAQKFRRFLRFRWNQQLFQFVSLLSVWPRDRGCSQSF